MLAVASSAYLAAVYLAADAAHGGHATLEQEFRRRALGAGVVAGLIALAGLFVVGGDYHRLLRELLSGGALAAVIASFLAGLSTLALVYLRRFQAARFTAAAAVAAVIAAWAVARWPTILPHLTVYRAAAGHDTLVWIVVAVLGGGALLFPALGLLFRLTLTGRFAAAERPDEDFVSPSVARSRAPVLARSAVALLVAGLGLLNVADADWMHALGVICFGGFIVAGFFAVMSDALLAPDASLPPGD